MLKKKLGSTVLDQTRARGNSPNDATPLLCLVTARTLLGSCPVQSCRVGDMRGPWCSVAL